MRIETPMDRQLQRNRRAALLRERKAAEEQATQADILGNPKAWDAAFDRALAQRNQALAAQQAAAAVIPAGIIKRADAEEEAPKEGKLERRISRELARFLNGMSIGAICAAIIIFAMMISAGIV